ncbi:unnamed protein product [Clonostachys chloroleuca]|uniref:Uncharacterized protein n=1 Tax=Clonostachys chloroleuca TaxID=1926264 RepID=A0AA35Q7X6_9HYPO|nr:unnamed protein product [Clonostachys chloroleuca]
MLARTALVTLLPAAVSALRDVVATSRGSGCEVWPNYDAATGVAGPWLIQLSEAENTAIDGFSDTTRYSIGYNNGKPTIRWGSFLILANKITIPTRNDIAKTALRCSDGGLQAWTSTDLTPAGAPTAVAWTPIVLSPYPYDAALMYKIEGSAPQLYSHKDATTGEEIPGYFLGGADGATTWGVKYYPADQGSYGRDYYYLRLLGPGSEDPSTGEPLHEGETKTYLKVAV